MPRLPQVERRLALTPQAESLISADDIETPYRLAASALSSISANLGEREREHQAGVDAGELARRAPDVEAASERFQQDADGDERTYSTAMDDFRRGLAGNAPAHLRPSIELMVEKERAQGLRSIRAVNHHAEVGLAETRIRARQQQVQDRLGLLAREGHARTEEFASLGAEFADLTDQLSGNSEFSYTPKEAADAADGLQRRLLAESFVGDVIRAPSIADAEKIIARVGADTSLNLSPSERQTVLGYAKNALEVRVAENKTTVDRLAAQSKMLKSRIELGIGIDDTDVSETIDSLNSAGAFKEAADLTTTRTNARFSGMSDSEQLAMTKQVIGGSGSVVDRIVQVESGGDPNAQASTSSARGLGQFVEGTWNQFLAARHPDLIGSGLDLRTDPDLSREAVQWLIGENTAALQAAGVEATPGAVYLSHFLGAGGAIAMLKASPIRSAADINPEAAKANPSVFFTKDGAPRGAGEIVAWASARMAGATSFELPPEVAKHMLDENKADLARDWENIQKGFDALPPSIDELTAIFDRVKLLQDPDERAKYRNEIASYQGGYLVKGLPPAQAEAAMAEVQAGVDAGSVPRELGRSLLEQMGRAAAATEAGLAKNALEFGASAGVATVKPLDFSSSETLEASLRGRAGASSTIGKRYGVPGNFFLPGELSSIKNAIDTDPGFIFGLSRSLQNALPAQDVPRALAEISKDSPLIAHATGLAIATGDDRILQDTAEALALRKIPGYQPVSLKPEAKRSTIATTLGAALLRQPELEQAVIGQADALFELRARALALDPANDPTGAAALYAKTLDEALGGRSVNGVHYGGLVDVNGAPTVAPSDMPSDDLEAMLAALTDSDLASLPPTWTPNGVSLKASDLAAAHLVRIGDGRYEVAVGEPGSPDPRYVMASGARFAPMGAGGHGVQAWVLDARQLAALQKGRGASTGAVRSWGFGGPVQ